MPEYTTAQILDAMEDNGYPKLSNGSYMDNIDEPSMACAIGQAAINLKVDPYFVGVFLRSLWLSEEGQTAFGFVTYQNDYTGTPIPEIAKQLRSKITDEQKERLLDTPAHNYIDRRK